MFFVDLFFELFHLFIFLFLGFYFYRKYYKQDLISQIEQEKDKIKNLIEKDSNSELIIKNISHQIADQEKLCILLIEKVRFWSKIIEDSKSVETSKREQLFEELSQKRSLQLSNYYALKTETELLPEIMVQIKKELQEKYESKENQDKYIGKILKFIKV